MPIVTHRPRWTLVGGSIVSKTRAYTLLGLTQGLLERLRKLCGCNPLARLILMLSCRYCLLENIPTTCRSDIPTFLRANQVLLNVYIWPAGRWIADAIVFEARS